MDKETKAYLAGFLDGEGYVGIVRRKMSGKHNFTPTVSIGLSNRFGSEKILKTFKRYYGGNYSQKKKIYMYNGTFKSKYPTISYYAQHIKAINMLKDLLPYLKIKRRQALVAISCGKNRCISRRAGLSDRERLRRSLLWQKSKELNV